MRILITITAAGALIAGPVHPAEPIKPTLDLTELKLEVHWVTSENAIRAAAYKYGQHVEGPVAFGASRVYSGRMYGFSVLFHNRATGEFTCEVWVFRPDHLDDDETLSLGHELLHCMLGSYHR